MTNQNPDACVHCGLTIGHHCSDSSRCPTNTSRFDPQWHPTNRFTPREQSGQCSAEGRTQSTQPLHGTLPVVKAAEVARPHVEQVSSPATVQPSEWRELEPEERVQKGDEVANLGLNDWEPVANSVGSPVKHWSWLKFRRRVQPPTASAEPGRSLTVLEAILEARLESVLKANLGFRIPGSDSIRVNDVIADIQSQLAAEKEARVKAEERIGRLESSLRDRHETYAFGGDVMNSIVLKRCDKMLPGEIAINALHRWIFERDDFAARVERLEKERQFPDIGQDPLQMDKMDGFEESFERLKSGLNKQQAGVPDQTALVWRVDISRVSDELILQQARGNSFMSAMAENARLKREVEELREALKPLAEIPTPQGLDDFEVKFTRLITAEDIHKARALVERKEGQ